MIFTHVRPLSFFCIDHPAIRRSRLNPRKRASSVSCPKAVPVKRTTRLPAEARMLRTTIPHALFFMESRLSSFCITVILSGSLQRFHTDMPAYNPGKTESRKKGRTHTLREPGAFMNPPEMKSIQKKKTAQVIHRRTARTCKLSAVRW